MTRFELGFSSFHEASDRVALEQLRAFLTFARVPDITSDRIDA